MCFPAEGLVLFQLTNPEWKPPDYGQHFITHLKEQGKVSGACTVFFFFFFFFFLKSSAHFIFLFTHTFIHICINCRLIFPTVAEILNVNLTIRLTFTAYRESGLLVSCTAYRESGFELLVLCTRTGNQTLSYLYSIQGISL